MVKKHNMASGDHTISGNPAEYYEMTSGGGEIGYPADDKSGRGAGARIVKQPLPYGGEPALYGVTIDYPNSNVDGIRNSTDNRGSKAQGMSSSSIGTAAPMRHPVSGTNPMKPIQRK